MTISRLSKASDMIVILEKICGSGENKIGKRMKETQSDCRMRVGVQPGVTGVTPRPSPTACDSEFILLSLPFATGSSLCSDVCFHIICNCILSRPKPRKESVSKAYEDEEAQWRSGALKSYPSRHAHIRIEPRGSVAKPEFCFH